MDGLFISYRRQDAGGHAGRLRDHLRARFGQRVFQDVDDIPDGEIFENVLARALASCSVGMVVIGPRWLEAVDDAGRRRLDAPDDWVRTEIRQLLVRAIRVIPVLVGGARMPTAEMLPDDLKPLAKRQARELRDASWDADMAALIRRLDEALGLAPVSQPAPAPVPPPQRPLWAVAAAALVLLAAVGGWALWGRGGESGTEASSPAAGASQPEEGAAAPAGNTTPPAADPTLAAATALGLPGTRWTMEDFSGMEPESPMPKTYEFVVRDGAVLLQGAGTTAQDRMLARQIHGRAITLLPQPPDGKAFDFMYVFELAADGSKLDQCQTVRVANLEDWGHASGATSAPTPPSPSP